MALCFETATCGPATVIGYKNYRSVQVLFTETGTIITTKTEIILKDRPRLLDPLAKTVFGMGCIGVGRHKAHCKGADTRAYGVWRAMLRRCYYRGSKHHPFSYEGVQVCKEWHCFQVFADWYEEHYPEDDLLYELDKDIRTGMSDLYSPERCMFVTPYENLQARLFKSKGSPIIASSRAELAIKCPTQRIYDDVED